MRRFAIVALFIVLFGSFTAPIFARDSCFEYDLMQVARRQFGEDVGLGMRGFIDMGLGCNMSMAFVKVWPLGENYTWDETQYDRYAFFTNYPELYVMDLNESNVPPSREWLSATYTVDGVRYYYADVVEQQSQFGYVEIAGLPATATVVDIEKADVPVSVMERARARQCTGLADFEVGEMVGVPVGTYEFAVATTDMTEDNSCSHGYIQTFALGPQVGDLEYAWVQTNVVFFNKGEDGLQVSNIAITREYDVFFHPAAFHDNTAQNTLYFEVYTLEGLTQTSSTISVETYSFDLKTGTATREAVRQADFEETRQS